MLTGLRNFRDLSTADPARIRPGLIFRSDTLTRLDTAGREAFAAAGITTVLDLRTTGEVQSYGHFHGDAGYHNVPVLTDIELQPYEPQQTVARYWAEQYLRLIAAGAPQIAQAITVLAEPKALPAILHCAGGRDRTGVISALILALLGVPDEAIAADYARSAESARGDDPEYADTPAETMLLVLAGLRDRHGDITGYAHTIGISQETIDHLCRQVTRT